MAASCHCRQEGRRGVHIPDGFLSTPVWAGMDVVSAGAVAVASRRVNRNLDASQVPLMGMTAAFVFAAQMINFPVAGGTSGHLLGGLLAALLLGPAPAVVAMATVFVAQCLLFQDGGLTALGANLFNMGIVGCIGGYGCYQLLRFLSVRDQPAIAVAAWLSVMAGAAATSIELGLSGTVPLRVVLPVMLSVHALIGVGEAMITVAALALLRRARPELLEPVAG
jgi:cobalt/nickel transport system permease protein